MILRNKSYALITITKYLKKNKENVKMYKQQNSYINKQVKKGKKLCTYEAQRHTHPV